MIQINNENDAIEYFRTVVLFCKPSDGNIEVAIKFIYRAACSNGFIEALQYEAASNDIKLARELWDEPQRERDC